MTAVAVAAGRTLSLADLLRIGSLGLRTRRLRAVLSAVGIAIGIAAMVAVIGISSSSRADLVAQLDRLGTNLLTVTPGSRLGGDDATLPEAAPDMVRRVGPVEGVTATGVVSGTVRRTDRISESETGGISIVAASTDLVRVLSGTMQRGTFLNAATERYPAVVLGAVAAQRLGVATTDGPVRVYVAGNWFTVVGVLEPLPLADEIDRAAVIGFPIAEALLDFDGSPSTIYVRSQPESVEAVREVLGPTVNPANPEEVQVSRPSDVLEARAATETAFTALLLGLGSVALLVGGVGIANIMVIAVLERRSEIGLRRALGATRRHIAVQFMTEALLLSFGGGALGVLAGAVATIVYASSRSWTIALPPLAGVGGLAAAVVTGVVAGAYPAVRAARLSPTDALRTA